MTVKLIKCEIKGEKYYSRRSGEVKVIIDSFEYQEICSFSTEDEVLNQKLAEIALKELNTENIKTMVM